MAWARSSWGEGVKVVVALRADAPRIRVLQAMVCLSVVLALVAGSQHAYDPATTREWLVGSLALLGVAVGLQYLKRRGVRDGVAHRRVRAVDVGLVLGLLWAIEIAINNLLAPPLPGRDTFDSAVWAIISLVTLALAGLVARETGKLSAAVTCAAWVGFASGLVACLTAVCLIVFGMPLLVADPVNAAEWSARGAQSGALNMTDYFALETFAGALAHLLVIGLVMGAVLGVMGGSVGLVSRRFGRGRVGVPAEPSTSSERFD